MAKKSYQDWLNETIGGPTQNPEGLTVIQAMNRAKGMGGLEQAYQYDQQFGSIPTMPDYHKITNPDGTMQSQFQVNPGADITADTQGLNAFRNRALSQGPSAWAQMQTKQQMGNAAQQSASGIAQADSNLAMRGGLDSGAAERIQTQGQKDLVNTQQNAASNVATQDEQMRQNALSQLPGMEIAATEPAFRNKAMNLNAQQFNTSNAIGENRAQNLADVQNYQTKMSGWAAGRQADATANSGGSCWLISGLARHIKLPADEADLLTRFKAHMLVHHKDAAKFYIRRCGKLVTKMDSAGFNWLNFKWFNDALVHLLRAGEFEVGFSLFRSTLTGLILEYWSDCPFEFFAKDVQRRAKLISYSQTVKMPELEHQEKGLTVPCLQNLSSEQFEQRNK